MTSRQGASLIVIAGVLIILGSIPLGAWLLAGPGVVITFIGLYYRDRPLTLIAHIVLVVMAGFVLWLTVPDIDAGIPSLWIMATGGILSLLPALLMRPSSQR